jgi:hypothetical protein
MFSSASLSSSFARIARRVLCSCVVRRDRCQQRYDFVVDIDLRHGQFVRSDELPRRRSFTRV